MSAARDPFPSTPDVDAYVPRPASDAAFAALCETVFNRCRVAVLTGPAGLGKTLLLRRLAAAVPEDLTPVVLPYAALGPDELCSWVLATLDAEPTDDPIGFFRTYVRHLHENRTGVLLVVDDATALPLASARWLSHLASGSDGALRMALAAGDSAATGRLLAALGEDSIEVRLSEPMTEAETRDYLRARLARAEASAQERARFDDDTVARLQRSSGGVPRLVNAAAAEVLRGESPGRIGGVHDETVAEGEGPPGPPELQAVLGDDALIAELTGARAGRSAGESDAATPEDAPPASHLPRPGEGVAAARAAGPSLEPSSDRAAEPPSAPVAEPDPASATRGGVQPDADFYHPRPAPRRVEPAPGLRWVILIALLVAGAAVTIPLMRAQLAGDATPRTAALPAPPTAPSEGPPRARQAAPAARAEGATGESDASRVESALPAPSAGEEEALTTAANPPPGAAARTPSPDSMASPERAGPHAPPTPGVPAEPDAPARASAADAAAPGGDIPTGPATGAAGPFDVSINANPWATIEVDGIRVGITPLGAVPLVAGPHTFKAHMPDGRVVERVVVITAEDRFVSFE